MRWKSKRFLSCLVAYLIIFNLLFLFYPDYRAQLVPPNAVELRVGTDMAGTADITLDGSTPVPAGSLCEIRNATSNAVMETFYIGHGTEGPPGVFKDGEFDFLLTVGSNPYESRTVTIYVRVYDSSNASDSEFYGDSPPITVTGGTRYDLPAWELSEPLSSSVAPPDDDNSNDDSSDSTQDSSIVNPLVLFLLLSLGIIVIIYLLNSRSKSKAAEEKEITTRRRNSRMKK